MMAVNLCTIAVDTTKGDDVHKRAYVEMRIRQAEALAGLGAFTKNPEDYKAAKNVVRNQIEIPGYSDAYEAELPGTKARCEKILKACAAAGVN